MVSAFPYLLLRLPAVPRSALHALAYHRCASSPSDEAFEADAAEADPAAVALLQSQPFFAALEEANPELAGRVSKLPRVAADRMKKKERQTVRAALRYLWRAALRPVPCGLLCGTAIGVLDDVPAVPPDLRPRETVPAMKAAAVSNVEKHPVAARRCRLYLEPSLRADDAPERFRLLASVLTGASSTRWSDLIALGFAEDELVAALETGVAGLCAAAPGEDERTAWERVLWESVPHDIRLLEPLAALHPPARRVDSCHRGVLHVPDDGITRFLEEIADLGSRIADDIAPENRAAARILRSHGSPMSIGELFQRYQRDAIIEADDESMSFTRRSRRRLALRFRRAPDGPDGPRHHLIFFGGSRMSLLPRYASLPYAEDLATPAREWMGRWPELRELYGVIAHDADVHAPSTRKVIHCAGPPPSVFSTRLADLRVALRSDGVPLLIDTDDTPVQPAFFGVAAEYALPPLVRFALMLGQPEQTVLEKISRSLGQSLGRRLAGCSDAIETVPEVTFGSAVVVAPRLYLVPATALPRVATPVTRRGFFEVRDWLRRVSLPDAFVQCSAAGEEPQWLDLRTPEGVNNFFRKARASSTLIVTASFLDSDEQGLRGADGWYEPECYAEVAYETCPSILIRGAHSSFSTPPA